MIDMVNNPPHYKQHASGREVIEATEGLPACLSHALKYALRAPHKHADPMIDWGKAEWYLWRQLSWNERHPVRAFFQRLVVLVIGRPNDKVLAEMLAAEEDEVTQAVIAAAQTGFEMDIDHAIEMIRLKRLIFNDYPPEVLNA